MKKSVYWIVPLLMMFGLGLYGCADSLREGRGDVPSDLNNSQGSDDGEWIPYTMEFNASDMITPSLRALTEEGENDIKGKVRVLVFDSQANTFAYEAPVTAITPADNKKTGKVQLLLKNTEATPYKIVMLANLQEATPEIELSVGDSYDNVMKKFTYAMPATGVWEGGDLPMWGEITAVVNHDEGANPQIGTINLIRAVARIDVGLSVTKGQGDPSFVETAAGIDGITMTSVKFYNMNDKGMVAPASANLEENSATKVKAPTVPTEASRLLGALNMSKEIIESKLLQRSVYVPEAKNDLADATQSDNGETHTEGNQDNYMKRPYMVVGLIGADKSNPSKETFFRIDFLEKTGAEATAQYKYLPLLRNYRYLVNITNVGGPGFDKEEDAQKGPAANIMYNVVVWNESDMTDVMYDGQYMLGVSQDHFKFYREGGTLTAKVQTSWPEGFSVKNLPDWISYSISEGGKITDEKIVTFKVTDHVTENRTYPESPDDAENALKAAYVQAGRMKWFLHFEQSSDLNLDINIYEDEHCTEPLGFISLNQLGSAYNEYNPSKRILGEDGKPLSAEEARASVTFYVKTEPGNLAPTFNEDVTGHFSVESQGEVGEGTGIWKYKVTAKDITENDNYFESHTNAYFFKITHAGTNKTVKAKLVVLQKEYNAIPFADESLSQDMLKDPENAVYIMNGEPQAIYMQANAEYKLEVVSSEPDGVNLVEGGFKTINESDPSLSGKPIPFTPVNDMVKPKIFAGKVLMKLSSPLGLFPTREFYLFFKSAIIQPEANTYMIKTGARQGILIPVSRVNTARDYYETLLDQDVEYFVGGVGVKESKQLPGTKQTYMLNELAEDDNYTVEIVWTDINMKGETNPVKRAGLKQLARHGKGGPNSYVYVEAGDMAGNVLIAIRSNKIVGKPILWSWHIWIMEKYPNVYTISKSDLTIGLDGGRSHMPESVKVMGHLIGASLEVTKPDNHDTWQEHGFQYQWGRKDPFPAAQVRHNARFYDGKGQFFDFMTLQRGVKANFGDDDARNAVGAAFTMRGSIENPNSIVSHRSAWQFEQFPIGEVDYFKDKYIFNYPWYRYDSSIDLSISVRDKKGRKTVFDPSPYGFRIMDFGEAVMLRMAYAQNKLKAPMPGWIYDGAYTDGASGGNNAIYAVSVSRQDAPYWSGYYLINTSGWTWAGNTSRQYRRACAISVRPVEDKELYGNPAKEPYTNYLPQ